MTKYQPIPLRKTFLGNWVKEVDGEQREGVCIHYNAPLVKIRTGKDNTSEITLFESKVDVIPHAKLTTEQQAAVLQIRRALRMPEPT